MMHKLPPRILRPCFLRSLRCAASTLDGDPTTFITGRVVLRQNVMLALGPLSMMQHVISYVHWASGLKWGGTIATRKTFYHVR